MDAKRTRYFHSRDDRPPATLHAESEKQTKDLARDKRTWEPLDEDRESDDRNIDADIFSAFERISAIWDSMCSDDEDDCE